MTGASRWAAPDDLARLRASRGGRPLRYLPTVLSTNDAARDWLDAGGEDGLAVLAREQTAGRGRRGRSWSSPPGLGLYLSVGWRPDLPGERSFWLTLMAGVAVAEGLRTLPLPAELRWPNDIDIRGRKAAGVLAECRLLGERVTLAVVGIGVNLLHARTDFPPEARDRATSLLQEGLRAPSAPAVALPILQRLDAWYGRLRTEPASALGTDLLDRWRELCPGHRGQPVEVSSGVDAFRGVTDGLAPDGALRVVLPGGETRQVRAGEVWRVRELA